MKIIRKILFISIFTVLCSSLTFASSRISLGVSCLSLGSQNTLPGENYGIKRIKSIAPALLIEGEVVPVEQFSIFLRADVAPFSPTIKANNSKLPLDQNVLTQYSLTGLFQLGCGWQLPLSFWTAQDFPLELSVGLVGSLGLFHFSSLTPDYNYSAFSMSFGGGLFETASFYFDAFGLTLSSTQSFSFCDRTEEKLQQTSKKENQTDNFIGTPVIFSWDISLSFSYRLGR